MVSAELIVKAKKELDRLHNPKDSEMQKFDPGELDSDEDDDQDKD